MVAINSGRHGDAGRSGAGDVPSVWLTAAAAAAATMRRDGISIQPPSEGELHADGGARRPGAGWARRAPPSCVWLSVGDSRRQTCPSQNINHPKCGKAGRRNRRTPENEI